MSNKKLISILVPCYNEQEVLNKFYTRVISVINNLTKYNWEILFVNDGSKDKTLNIIKQLHAKDNQVSYVDLSRNFGKELAMIAGLDYTNSDAVIIMDADLQDPPELIPELIIHWEEGFSDVYAKRKNRAGETFFKKLSSKIYYRILQKLTRIPIQTDVGDFRLLDRQCIQALKSMRETQRYTKGMFSWIGYSKKEVIFERDARAAGNTKWNYLRLTELAIEGITSFTTTPLKLSSFIGIFVSILGFIYMIWIIIKTLLYGELVAGYPSLVSIMLFLGGLQLLVLGIIGEYLGRIFNESKNRPLYLVNEYNNQKIIIDK